MSIAVPLPRCLEYATNLVNVPVTLQVSIVFMTLVGIKETLHTFLMYGSVLLMYYDIVAGEEAGNNAAVFFVDFGC